MSIEAIAWALKQQTGDPTLKVLLIALANHVDEDGICWPSQKTLAAHTDISERTVRRKLGDLMCLGLIEVEDRFDDTGRRTSSWVHLSTYRPITIPLAAFIQERNEKGGVPANLTGSIGHSSDRGYRPLLAEQEPSLNHQSNILTFDLSPTEPAKPSFDIDAKFAEFKAAYPKRKGDAAWSDARDLFAKSIKEGASPDDIISGARGFAAVERENIGTPYIPQAVKWIRRKRWLDYKAAPPTHTDPKEARRQQAYEDLRSYGIT